MREFEEQPSVKRVVTAIVCNKCGKKKAKKDTDLGGPHLTVGFHKFEAEGHYGSTFPPDASIITFDVCSNCLKEWVESFRHEPDWAHHF